MDLNHPLLAAISDDPPPFPPNQPQLIRLDRAMLCQICKEPYQGPVTIACGHSFCSQCIRSSLDSTKKCPSCGETAGEGSIRRNRALEEMVDAWEDSRPVMINLSQPQASSSRKRPAPETGKNGSNEAIKRIRRDSLAPMSRSQSPTRIPDTSKGRNGVIEVLSSSAEQDLVDTLEADDEVEEEFEEEEELGENDEGECPICSARLSIASIPMHIERGCPTPKVKIKNGTGNQKADWKKVFGGVGATKTKEIPSKRITKPNYNLTSPSELRSILSSYSLPTTGDKPTLEQRLQEWIILFNSNLDTSHPKSSSALRARLAEVEASRRRDKEKGKDVLVEQLGSVKGLNEYAKEKKGEFERLRKEIMDRDKRKKGEGKEQPIEVD